MRLRIIAWIVLAAVVQNSAPQSVWGQDMTGHIDLNIPKMTESEVTRGEIEAMIGTGQPVDLHNKRLNHLDLSNLDLGGANFRSALLNYTDLSGAILDGADFSLAWTVEANFDGASLIGAQMFQTQMMRMSMVGADCTDARILANMTGAILTDTKFTNADMAPDMKNQSMGLMRAILKSATLKGADLRGADLNLADMEYAKLQGADLRDATLTRVKFGGAYFDGANIAGSNVAYADFDSAKIKGLLGENETINHDKARNWRLAYRH